MKSITRTSKAFDLYKKMFKDIKHKSKTKRIHDRRMSRENFEIALANMDIYLDIKPTSRRVSKKEIRMIIKFTAMVKMSALKQMAIDCGMKYGEFIKRWNKESDSIRKHLIHEYFKKHGGSEEDVYESEEVFEDDDFDLDSEKGETNNDRN